MRQANQRIKPTNQNKNTMNTKFTFLLQLKAKPGKESEVESFLQKGSQAGEVKSPARSRGMQRGTKASPAPISSSIPSMMRPLARPT